MILLVIHGLDLEWDKAVVQGQDLEWDKAFLTRTTELLVKGKSKFGINCGH